MSNTNSTHTDIDASSDDRSAPTSADLFCGAGGASLGLANAGFDLRFGVDNNPAALATYRENFEHPALELDLGEPDLARLPPELRNVDLDHLQGSFPCKSYSTAQCSRTERDPDDDRNELAFAFVEWVDALRPKVVTFENIPQLRSIRDGFLDEILDAFDDAGYRVDVRDLYAPDFGVPQTRTRLFGVGLREDIPEPDRRFPRETHNDPPRKTLTGRRQERYPTVRDAVSDLVEFDLDDVALTNQNVESYNFDGERAFQSVDEPIATIRGGTPDAWVRTDGDTDRPRLDLDDDGFLRGVEGSSEPRDARIRRLTPRESARFQTFPDEFAFVGDTYPVLEQIGNAVPPRLMTAVADTVRAILDETTDSDRATPQLPHQ